MHDRTALRFFAPRLFLVWKNQVRENRGFRWFGAQVIDLPPRPFRALSAMQLTWGAALIH